MKKQPFCNSRCVGGEKCEANCGALCSRCSPLQPRATCSSQLPHSSRAGLAFAQRAITTAVLVVHRMPRSTPVNGVQKNYSRWGAFPHPLQHILIFDISKIFVPKPEGRVFVLLKHVYARLVAQRLFKVYLIFHQ
jgi:hypothetical protein